MIGLVCAIIILVVLMVVVALAAPWIGFVMDKYLEWCSSVQTKWKR